MPIERYNSESFKKPFCPDGDLFHWLFAIDILERKSNHEIIPSVRRATSKAIESGTTSFDVIWKTSKFNNPTGLCLNGPIAGYYVSKWHERQEVVYVVKGRPVSMDGGTFSPNRALHKIIDLETRGVEVAHIKAELSQSIVIFPRVLAATYMSMDYPIDIDSFMNNVAAEQLYWDTNLQQKNIQREIDSE